MYRNELIIRSSFGSLFVFAYKLLTCHNVAQPAIVVRFSKSTNAFWQAQGSGFV